MATTTFLGAADTFTVGGVDLKDQLTSITITYTKEALEVTTLADSARKFGAGLQNNEITFTVLGSFATTEAVQTLFGDVGSTSDIAFAPVTGSPDTSAPKYELVGGYLASFPIVVNVGELVSCTVTYQGGTLTEDITP
jgi:hypothetical protein